MAAACGATERTAARTDETAMDDWTQRPPETRGAVRGWDAARGQAEVQLVGWEGWDEGAAAGEVLWSVEGVPRLAGDWERRARVSCALRADPAVRGDRERPSRARLIVEDAAGRRLFLPNRVLAPEGGWTELGGLVTTALPQPC